MKWKKNRKYKVMWMDDDDKGIWKFDRGDIIEPIGIRFPCIFKPPLPCPYHIGGRRRFHQGGGCSFSVEVNTSLGRTSWICGWRVKILREESRVA